MNFDDLRDIYMKSRYVFQEPVEIIDDVPHYVNRPLERRDEIQIYCDMWADEQEEIRKGLEDAIHDKDGPLPANNSWIFSNLEQWLYLMKAALCYAFGLWRKKKHGTWPDYVEVITTQSCQTSYGWSARYLVVGHGYFHNWFIEIQSDGDSFI